jgi:hypothetical protein
MQKSLVGFRGSNNGGRDAKQCESLVSGIKVAGRLVISQELVARMWCGLVVYLYRPKRQAYLISFFFFLPSFFKK